MLIREETSADHAAIRRLNRLSFGQDVEATLVDDLRASGHARLSLVADDGGDIVGHIFFSEIVIQTVTAVLPALSLAPMAVVPHRQRQGIGTQLIKEGLRRCAEHGDRIVVVLGHPDYYPRFGFTARLAERLNCPYSGPALMAIELKAGALDGFSGELKYSPPFHNL